MKKKLISIITCAMITAVMITTSINAKALSAGATYTAYEIISMIFAVVGGTTIEQTSGLVGGSSFNANGLYESMNTQFSGIGTLLSSYVNRAQYLNPGSDLVLSENDYNAFREYFRQYSIQSSTTGQITNESLSGIESQLSIKAGFTIPHIGSDMVEMINDGRIVYAIPCVYHGTNTPQKMIALVSSDVNLTYSGFGGNENIYIMKADIMRYATNSQYWSRADGGNLYIDRSTMEYITLVGALSAKADAIVTPKIKNGTYDTISKSRTWDTTQGKLKGPVTLTMPATSTLSDVLERENVKDITDAVNVYPTDTTDDSMIYYPTQSVPDFIVPTITVNPSIAFPGVDGGISDYTIELRNFFPFCIPWDIYDMLSAFVTTPATPEFTFQFPTGVINHQIQWTECTFDLHAWDGVAQGLRTLELIAFAVGLALMTRNIFLRG